MDNPTITAGMAVIVGIILLVALFVLCFVAGVRTTNEKPRSRGIIIISIVIALFILSAGCVLGSAVSNSYKHGNYIPWENVNLLTLEDNLDNSPVDQSTEAEQNRINTSNIYFVYRYGCADCNASHADLITYKERMERLGWNTYWISIKSSFGEKLKSEYNIDEVPTIIVQPLNGSAQTIPARAFMNEGYVDLNKLPQERP